MAGAWSVCCSADLSRLDWMVMRDMARSYPDASQLELMQAMRQGSPRLDERKAGHVDDYIICTIAKVSHASVRRPRP